jgi:predicted ArsR family transcriptional regulator
MQLIMSLLERAGFSPEAPRGPTEPIRLHRCPFGELAIERAGVICGLHLGMLRGVLREIEAPLSATRLEPFAGPGVCYAFVEPRTVR